MGEEILERTRTGFDAMTPPTRSAARFIALTGALSALLAGRRGNAAIEASLAPPDEMQLYRRAPGHRRPGTDARTRRS